WAGSQDKADRPDYPFVGDLSDSNWSSDSVLGMPVQTPGGDEIGQVRGIIFTPDDRVRGVVVDTGEYLGVATRPVVIDWAAIQIVPADRVLVVDVTKDQLKDTPEYTMAGNRPAAKGAETAEADIPASEIREDQPGVLTEESLEHKDLSAEGKGIGSKGGEAVQ
ncbi:MAG TPA: PRC-barrel domain-containing protein, partial [Planctomycetaceae bacterium]